MKNIILALFVLLAFTTNAWASLPGGSIWEVRLSNGSDTNGGGFVVGVSGTDVSGSATLVVDASNNKLVTSSAHSFVSGDINKYILVTSGTGWVKGWYQIKSISGSGAILGRSPAPVGTTGGTYSLYSGIDYSQQNAKNTTGSNISTTDAVANGTTTLTSATASFTSNVVGNIIYLAGGSGSLTGGWYEITAYTNSTTVTLDRTVASGTGITMNIGGALRSLTGAAGAAVSKNQVFVKAETTVTTSSSIAFTQSNLLLRGYTTDRADEGRVTVQATAGSFNVVSFKSGDIRNFVVDCNSQTGSTGINSTSSTTVVNSIVKNCAVYGIYLSVANAETAAVYDTEVYGNLTGSTAAIRMNSSTGAAFGELFNNYIHDGEGTAIIGPNGPFIAVNNVIANITGSGSNGIELRGSPAIITNNTVYNVPQYGIVIWGGGTNVAQNNILHTIGSDGIYFSNVGYPSPMSDGNAFFAITGFNNNGVDGTGSSKLSGTYENSRDVNFTYDPFVDAAGGDYSLNSTEGGGSAAKGTGFPSSYTGLSSTAYPDFGAIPAQAGAGGGGEASFVFGN